jgi:hypothetical protein
MKIEMEELNPLQIIFSFVLQIFIYLSIAIVVLVKKPRGKINELFSISLLFGALSNLFNLISFIQYLLGFEFLTMLKYVAACYTTQSIFIIAGYLVILLSSKMYIEYKINYIIDLTALALFIILINYPNSFSMSLDSTKPFIMELNYAILVLSITSVSSFVTIFILVYILKTSILNSKSKKIIIYFILIEISDFVHIFLLGLVDIHVLPMEFMNISAIFIIINSFLFAWVFFRYKNRTKNNKIL